MTKQNHTTPFLRQWKKDAETLLRKLSPETTSGSRPEDSPAASTRALPEGGEK